jgi:NADH dehydrogenase [ubiquinone] 1 alpha subcomplex assembly factor 7
MTLTDHLRARIARTGPLTMADYMTECLLHPDHGYYATRDPLGAAGDFVTAPEISQMFGEMIGLCLAQAWVDQGRPTPFTLAEAGPGRGTLMADILRATRGVPGFAEAATLVLVEVSPVLRDIQRTTLAAHTPDWVQTVDAVPQAPLFLVANEFFDALPVRQFVRDGALWRERCVGATKTGLGFTQTDPQHRPDLDHRMDDTNDGDLVEICPTAALIIAQIGQRIETHGGAALILDYGDWRSLGDTVQAVSKHRFADPLESPGQADLTAHVDFEALCQAAPCAHTKVTPQGLFLQRLGIDARADALIRAGGCTDRKDILVALHRLTHHSEMGNLFKTLGLFKTGTQPPPGLDT